LLGPSMTARPAWMSIASLTELRMRSVAWYFMMPETTATPRGSNHSCIFENNCAARISVGAMTAT